MCISLEHGTKKSESLTGIKPWPSRYLLGSLTTELRETLSAHFCRPFTRFIEYVTGVLYTARTRNVKSVISAIKNEDGKF